MNVSVTLRGLVVKEEQKSAGEALLLGKNDMAVLPTGFGKSIIHQSFVLVKTLATLIRPHHNHRSTLKHN